MYTGMDNRNSISKLRHYQYFTMYILDRVKGDI